MTLVSWKEFLDLVEVLLKCLAIIAGGVWATYTFGSLRQIARAKAEIANTEAERRKTEAELHALSERSLAGAVIEIDLSVTVLRVADDPRPFLSVLAEVSNKGNRNAQIEYPDEPFRVYSIDLGDPNLRPTLVGSAAVRSSVDPSRRSLKLLVRAGGRERLPFLVPVPGAGIYMLVLSLPLPEPEQAVANKFGFVSKGRWSAKRYVTVDEHTA